MENVSIILTNIARANQATPMANIRVVPQEVGQGKTFVIYINTPKKVKNVEGSLGGKKLKFYKTGFGFRTAIGIPIRHSTGNYQVVLIIVYQSDSQKTFKKTIRIKEIKYKSIRINIPSNKIKLLASSVLDQEGKKINEIIKGKRETYLAKGRFILPAQRRLTGPFGRFRIYNDGISSDSHRGIDIANSIGTKIVAANRGVVVLSEKLQAHGGTIIIDHGQGIFSIYCHFQQLDVNKGDFVEKGRQIGTMGQTGLSTGPHVHFGVIVGGVRVDPMEWVNRVVLQ